VRKRKLIIRLETTELVRWQSISVHIQTQQCVWHSGVPVNTTKFDECRVKDRMQRDKKWVAGCSVCCNRTSTTVLLRRSIGLTDTEFYDVVLISP